MNLKASLVFLCVSINLFLKENRSQLWESGNHLKGNEPNLAKALTGTWLIAPDFAFSVSIGL